jgi:DNA-binding response OmpR family regulator
MNELLENVFGAETTPETPQEVLDQLDNEFLTKALGAMEFLAVKLPERFIEILAVLSAIEKDILKKQKMVKLADVYDAVIEANNVELLIARIKKSLGVTKAAMKFLNLRKKVTQQ